MLKTLYLYPYKMGSRSAKLIASKLGIKRIKQQGSKFKYKPTRHVINWGSSTIPPWHNDDRPITNSYKNVPNGINKLKAFQKFTEFDVPCPDWTTEPMDVVNWLKEGYSVLSRTKLNSSGGMGIFITHPGDEAFVDAPLYVKYKKKKKEFRVHVFNGKVIDVVQKRKRRNTPNIDTYIRSHSNGWVFTRSNIVEPDDLRLVAIKAIQALGLDFGGVDVIWNEKENKCYVLEVNSAPGIEGTTLEKYCDAIKELAHEA